MIGLTTEQFLLGLLVSYFIPLLTALVSRRHWPAEVQGIITSVLAFVTALLTEVIAHPDTYSFSVVGLHALFYWAVAWFARNQTWRTGANGLHDTLLSFPSKQPAPAAPPKAA